MWLNFWILSQVEDKIWSRYTWTAPKKDGYWLIKSYFSLFSKIHVSNTKSSDWTSLKRKGLISYEKKSSDWTSVKRGGWPPIWKKIGWLNHVGGGEGVGEVQPMSELFEIFFPRPICLRISRATIHFFSPCFSFLILFDKTWTNEKTGGY